MKTPKRKRGFAAMPKDIRQEIASLGGKAVSVKHGKEYMQSIGSLGGMITQALNRSRR
jgi:general stress protein YciG